MDERTSRPKNFGALSIFIDSRDLSDDNDDGNDDGNDDDDDDDDDGDDDDSVNSRTIVLVSVATVSVKKLHRPFLKLSR